MMPEAHISQPGRISPTGGKAKLLEKNGKVSLSITEKLEKIA